MIRHSSFGMLHLSDAFFYHLLSASYVPFRTILVKKWTCISSEEFIIYVMSLWLLPWVFVSRMSYILNRRSSMSLSTIRHPLLSISIIHKLSFQLTPWENLSLLFQTLLILIGKDVLVDQVCLQMWLCLELTKWPVRWSFRTALYDTRRRAHCFAGFVPTVLEKFRSTSVFDKQASLISSTTRPAIQSWSMISFSG